MCGEPAMNTCKLCGRLACDRCVEPRTGICLACFRKGGEAHPDVSGGRVLR